MIRTFSIFIVSLFFALSAKAQTNEIKEYQHPDILSFESMPDNVHAKQSSINISTKHFKHLQKSLCWQLQSPNASLSIRDTIPYLDKNPLKDDEAVASFVFWVYLERPFPGKYLRFEFLKNGKVCSYFDYGTNFKGWSGAWISFKANMKGTPKENMDELRITAPGIQQTDIFFDHVILCSYQDPRFATADFQAPWNNAASTNHWLVLNKSWNNNFDIPLPEQQTEKETKDIETISKRLTEQLLKNRKPRPLKDLTKRYLAYQIHYSPQKDIITGLPIFFERYGETYENWGAPNYTKIFNNSMGVKHANKLMLDMAVSYHLCENPETKDSIADMYINLSKHMIDQGFRAGSAMGTLHHLGYSMKDYYAAPFLMKDVLERANILSPIQQAMDWFSGLGEIKVKDVKKGMDIDAFNTSLLPRLEAILLLPASAEKTRYMRSFKRWIDNGLRHADGTRDSFKSDGTIFHHRHHYPAYATGGVENASNCIYLLHNTCFAIAQDSHKNLKNALLAMRVYCKLRTWPLSMSGRHPTGKGQLVPHQYARLAESGTPDGKAEIDPDLARAYLRLDDGKRPDYTQLFKDKGFTAEKSPEGVFIFPYAVNLSYWHNDCLATATGFSRYIWASEIYRGSNLYGRYLNYGSLEIISGHSLKDSGFRQEGWDWRFIPGTTAPYVSFEKLLAEINQTDPQSGYEEMLLSDQTHAGAVSLDNKVGLWSNIIKEHDKYDGSFKAYKTYYFAKDRIYAIGSGIHSDENPVTTTLFQKYIETDDVKDLLSHPKKETIESGNLISDGYNNFYYLVDGQGTMTSSVQKSRDQSSGKETQNPFRTAVLWHGEKPQNASYQYLILMQPNGKRLESFKRQTDKKDGIEVLKADQEAHVLKDGSILAVSSFEAADIPDDILSHVNGSSILLMNKLSQKTIEMSVVNPDLAFYTGEAEEQYDKDGKVIEKSIYTKSWIDNPSQYVHSKIVLNGIWHLEKENANIEIKSSNNKTYLDIKTIEGKAEIFKLIQKTK